MTVLQSRPWTVLVISRAPEGDQASVDQIIWQAGQGSPSDTVASRISGQEANNPHYAWGELQSQGDSGNPWDLTQRLDLSTTHYFYTVVSAEDGNNVRAWAARDDDVAFTSLGNMPDSVNFTAPIPDFPLDRIWLGVGWNAASGDNIRRFFDGRIIAAQVWRSQALTEVQLNELLNDPNRFFRHLAVSGPQADVDLPRAAMVLRGDVPATETEDDIKAALPRVQADGRAYAPDTVVGQNTDSELPRIQADGRAYAPGVVVDADERSNIHRVLANGRAYAPTSIWSEDEEANLPRVLAAGRAYAPTADVDDTTSRTFPGIYDPKAMPRTLQTPVLTRKSWDEFRRVSRSFSQWGEDAKSRQAESDSKFADLEARVAALEQAGGEDLEPRVEALETEQAAQAARITTNEGNISANQSDIAQNKLDITVLDGRVTTVEASVLALEASQSVQDGRLNTLETTQTIHSGRLDSLEQTQQLLVDGIYGHAESRGITGWSPGVTSPTAATRIPLQQVIMQSNVGSTPFALVPNFSADYWVDVRINLEMSGQNNRNWTIALFEDGVQQGNGYTFNTRTVASLELTARLGDHMDAGDEIDIRLWSTNSGSSLTIAAYSYSLFFAGIDNPTENQ